MERRARVAPKDVPALEGATKDRPLATHGCAILGHGLRCWGANGCGQLGYPTTTLCGEGAASSPCSTVPRAVAGFACVRDVQVATRRTCAETCAGERRCWGAVDDDNGQARIALPGRDAGAVSAPCPLLGSCRRPARPRSAGIPRNWFRGTTGASSRWVPVPPYPPPCAPGATGASVAEALCGRASSRAALGRGPRPFTHRNRGNRRVDGMCMRAGHAATGVSASLAVGTVDHHNDRAIYLRELCTGDDSAYCCPLVATGQEVIVTGELEMAPWSNEVLELRHPSVCEMIDPAAPSYPR